MFELNLVYKPGTEMYISDALNRASPSGIIRVDHIMGNRETINGHDKATERK